MKPFGHGNYHGLKLADQVTKLLERVLDSFIHRMVNIDEMQFVFVPGKGTPDAISIVRQLQKYITAKKLLYFAFVDLEKAFDHVPGRPYGGINEPRGWGMSCACHPGEVL